MKKINCKKSELNLLFTLSGGQCFRWHLVNDNQWRGVFADRVWTLWQDEDSLFYEVIGESAKTPSRKPRGKKKQNPDPEQPVEEEILKEYFRLDELNLHETYAKWASCDEHFKDAARKFQGIRILKQDPVENVFSFICSSNNHISRISSMVEKLCQLFGRPLASAGGQPFHAFPCIEALAAPGVEQQLRAAGFGYRAAFVQRAAQQLTELGGQCWLQRLRALPYPQARQQLMALTGVGAKVADCVCLMSLGHLGAVPVDTHIFQVAARWYLPQLRSARSVTPQVHETVGNFFRGLYGPLAGWAHTILFCSNLKLFSDDKTSEKQNPRKGKKRKVSNV